MTYIFEEWKEVLEKFQKCVDQGVEEMHQQKEEVQQIKDDIFSRLDSGNIIRDDRRIVLSAPEIIIGDVDKSGTLTGEMGTVIVRGHHVALEGAGESGSVVTRAPLIEQKAVNWWAPRRRSSRRPAPSCSTAAMPPMRSRRCRLTPATAASVSMPTAS